MARPVLLTTEFRGVFYGEAENTGGSEIHLKGARNVIYWPKEAKGVFGLAAEGPPADTRLGPAVDLELRKVTAVVEVTEHAAKRFREFVWSP